MKRLRIDLPGGGRRPAVIADPDAKASRVISALRLKRSKGLVVLNGGTEMLSEDLSRQLFEALHDGLVPVVEKDGLTMLTGGTDAGIFQVLGQAFNGSPGKRTVVGVAPSELVAWDRAASSPGDGRVALEPHHTHFVLVDGDQWGDETKLLLDLAGRLGRYEPSVAVLASGGSISRAEVLGHVRAGRPVVVLKGTGRLADEVVRAADEHGSDSDPVLNEIAYRGRIIVVDLPKDGKALGSVIRRELESTRRRRAERKKPALLRRWPKLRWKPPNPLRQLVGLEDQMQFPTMAKDLAFLSNNLLDAYRRCDSEALKQQNSFYKVSVLALAGSVIATILGALQAVNAGPGFVWGLAETVLAAVLGGSLVVATAKSAQRGFYTNRLKAERLRSEYFRYLARHGPYADDASREPALKDRVMAIETTSGGTT